MVKQENDDTFSSCTGANECAQQTHNCDQNADCTDLPTGFTCKCKEGFEGDGLTCQGDLSIDVCLQY